jgi:uncharacterized protein with FMN-binding domain
MKIYNNLLFILVIANLSLMSCVSREIKEVRELKIENIDLNLVKSGAYEGDFSYGNYKYVVNVIVEKHKIMEINIINNRNTKYSKMAEGVIQEILTEQKSNVDAISGATTTSKALLKAVENALNKGKM